MALGYPYGYGIGAEVAGAEIAAWAANGMPLPANAFALWRNGPGDWQTWAVSECVPYTGFQPGTGSLFGWFGKFVSEFKASTGHDPWVCYLDYDAWLEALNGHSLANGFIGNHATLTVGGVNFLADKRIPEGTMVLVTQPKMTMLPPDLASNFKMQDMSTGEMTTLTVLGKVGTTGYMDKKVAPKVSIKKAAVKGFDIKLATLDEMTSALAAFDTAAQSAADAYKGYTKADALAAAYGKKDVPYAKVDEVLPVLGEILDDAAKDAGLTIKIGLDPYQVDIIKDGKIVAFLNVGIPTKWYLTPMADGPTHHPKSHPVTSLAAAIAMLYTWKLIDYVDYHQFVSQPIPEPDLPMPPPVAVGMVSVYKQKDPPRYVLKDEIDKTIAIIDGFLTKPTLKYGGMEWSVKSMADAMHVLHAEGAINDAQLKDAYQTFKHPNYALVEFFAKDADEFGHFPALHAFAKSASAQNPAPDVPGPNPVAKAKAKAPVATLKLGDLVKLDAHGNVVKVKGSDPKKAIIGKVSKLSLKYVQVTTIDPGVWQEVKTFLNPNATTTPVKEIDVILVGGAGHAVRKSTQETAAIAHDGCSYYLHHWVKEGLAVYTCLDASDPRSPGKLRDALIRNGINPGS